MSLARHALVLGLALGLGLSLGCASQAAPATASPKYEAPDERFIFFTPGRAEVPAEGYFSVGYVAALLDTNAAYRVVVVGHADPLGSPAQNRELCLKRARIVRKILAERGVKEDRIDLAIPRATTDAAIADLSRRADLFVYDPRHEKAEARPGYPVELTGP